MKYLVNRETKEHKVYSGTEFYDDEAWRVVDADDEGWIKWNDGECPLPKNAKVDLKWKFGGDNYKNHADGWNWEGGGSNRILFYRPNLKGDRKPESKPTLEETWHKIKQEAQIDVFTRFASALIHARAIPDIIAEINAMLPEGYEVTRK